MASDFSFDVVSELNVQEVENAYHQVTKEIGTRFDFKGSVSRIEWDKKEKKLTLWSDDDYKLKSVIDILQNKLVKRGISLKSLDYKPVEAAEGGSVRQVVQMKNGIESDKAKEIVRACKDQKFKANISIQGEQLRVSAKSKDELQSVIAFLRGSDFGLPLQFTNYR